MWIPQTWAHLFADNPGAASVLLTLATVNGTVVAFVLGLRIVAMQLSARFDLPRVRLGWSDLVFIGTYALLNVILPIVAALHPTEAWVVLCVFLSIALGISVPLVMRSTIAAGLPRGLINSAVRKASGARSSKTMSGRLLEGANTLTSIRVTASSDSLRAESQSGLFRLMELALIWKLPAAGLVTAVLGDADGREAQRASEFAEWIESRFGSMLLDDRQATDTAFQQLQSFALETGRSHEIRATVLQAVARFSAFGIAERHRQCAFLRVGRTESFFALSKRHWAEHDSVEHWPERLAQLASLVFETSPKTLTARPHFKAICSLFTIPFAQMRIGNHVSVHAEIKGLRRLFDPLVLDTTEEADFRIEQLASSVIEMVEHLQSQCMLATDDTRDLLRLYLDWVDALAAADRTLLIESLTKLLNLGFSSRFQGISSSSRTIASSAEFATLLKTLVPRFAETVVALEAMYSREQGEQSMFASHTGLNVFDPVRWGHHLETAEIAPAFYTELERRFLAPQGHLKHQLKDVMDLHTVNMDRRHDILSDVVAAVDRPDTLLAILRSRWSLALREDRMRPEARRRAEEASRAEMLAGATAETREALEALFSQPTNDFPTSFESLADRVVTRDLLKRSVELRAQGEGIGSSTYESWRAAADLWLERTGRDDDAEDDLRESLTMLPQDAASLANYIDLPLRSDHSYAASARTDGVWRAIYGYSGSSAMAWREEQHDLNLRGALERTYWLLPVQDEWHEVVLVVEEHDGSRWMVPLIVDYGRDVQKTIPASYKYLARVLLEQVLGVLETCSACFGTTYSRSGFTPECPVCEGTGRTQNYWILRDALWRGVQEVIQLAPNDHQSISIRDSTIRQLLVSSLRQSVIEDDQGGTRFED